MKKEKDKNENKNKSYGLHLQYCFIEEFLAYYDDEWERIEKELSLHKDNK